jgi:hypothetical protein
MADKDLYNYLKNHIKILLSEELNRLWINSYNENSEKISGS